MNERPSPVEALSFEEVRSFPSLAEIQHGQLFALSLANRTTSYTHGLHRFPAKFVPQVPGWALDNFADARSVVVDPFAGSGTTLVEALTRGGTAIGLDIDPLARLLARAKTSECDHDRIAALSDEIRTRWTTPAKRLISPMADVANFEHWFSREQWRWLQSLLTVILDLRCSPEEREFLLVVFSSTLRLVSNADDQSQKTYVSGTRPKHPPPVPHQFWRFLSRAVEGLNELNQKRVDGAAATVGDGDALAMPLGDESVDLVITSPPYLDSVDYPYNMMLEYFWLGPLLGVPTRREYNALRRRPVGAKHPGRRLTLPPELTHLADLGALPASRGAAAATYFSMMANHFDETARCLKRGGRYVFVIGNSQSREHPLPVHEALITLAATRGLHLEKAFGYRIRRHYMKFPRAGRGGIILIDWVLVFSKGEGRQAEPLPLPWVTLSPDAVAH